VKESRTPSFCACPDGVQDTQRAARRVLWIWHAAVVAEYQKPLTLLGRCPDLNLTLLAPKRWPERAGQMVYAEEGDGARAGAYRLITARTLFTGLYYIYFYPSLLLHLLRLKPDIIYCYEEAHTLIGAAVLFLRRLFLPRSKVLLYAAQNIKKKYPLPFRLFELYCFRNTDGILACGTKVAQTLRAKGYAGLLRVVALPTDTQTFAPDPSLRDEGRRKWSLPASAVAIGYAGKLVEEKGLRTLMTAFEQVAHKHPHAHLLLAGRGRLYDEIEMRAGEAALADRVHLLGVVHNSDLPAFMNALDVFVLPSETRPNWREQFGRVVVEAMSCGTAAVGSDSGEIPTVLGEAGLIFPEGDTACLTEHLVALIRDPSLRNRLARKGRERVLRYFSTECVAAQHYDVYREMLHR
jgi:glycosyltransferase involved in cell wall biosynthesis